jgi:hypothetical protein
MKKDSRVNFTNKMWRDIIKRQFIDRIKNESFNNENLNEYHIDIDIVDIWFQ